MTTQTPAIEMVPVESSQIHSIGHCPDTNTLAIRFKNRTTGDPEALYHYSDFTSANFMALRDAESIGSHFYRNIKPHAARFLYVCIEKKPQDTENE